MSKYDVVLTSCAFRRFFASRIKSDDHDRCGDGVEFQTRDQGFHEEGSINEGG